MEKQIVMPDVSDPSFDQSALRDVVAKWPLEEKLSATKHKSLEFRRIYMEAIQRPVQVDCQCQEITNGLRKAIDEVTTSLTQVYEELNEEYSKLNDMMNDILLLQDSAKKDALVNELEQIISAYDTLRSTYKFQIEFWKARGYPIISRCFRCCAAHGDPECKL